MSVGFQNGLELFWSKYGFVEYKNSTDSLNEDVFVDDKVNTY
jgi:hypothetical protein